MQSNLFAKAQPLTEQMLLHPPRRYFSLIDCAGTVQNYCGTIVYLWLSDGREFWFYIDFCDQDSLNGCYWGNQCWNVGRVLTEHILAYC